MLWCVNYLILCFLTDSADEFQNEQHIFWHHFYVNWVCITANILLILYCSFCRAMHFSRLSVRLSVTLVNCDHIGWNSSKIISPVVSLGRSLFATPTRRVCSNGNTPVKTVSRITYTVLEGTLNTAHSLTPLNLGPKWPTPCWFESRRHSTANCGRMVTDSATVTMESL